MPQATRFFSNYELTISQVGLLGSIDSTSQTGISLVDYNYRMIKDFTEPISNLLFYGTEDSEFAF
jgi:hypothetical protein